MRLASLLGGLLVLAGFALVAAGSEGVALFLLLPGAAIEIVVTVVAIVRRVRGQLVDPRRELDRFEPKGVRPL